MKVLISGAAGFIGCHLARRYLEQGHSVIGVDNFCTGSHGNIEWLSEHDGFEFIHHDITSPLDVPGSLDLICDLACPASPVDFGPLGVEILDVCSRGVRNMLELARRKKTVFLHTSTSEVYGDPQEHPQQEGYWGHVNPIGSRSVYDEGKRFAEALIMAYHRRYAIPTRLARIFNTYGPRMRADDGRVVSTFIVQALAGQTLTVQGDGSQTRSFCYIDDQVDGLLRLVATDYTGPVNIGNPNEVTILELAHEIIALLDSGSEIVFTPIPDDDPRQRRPDISLAQKVLLWQPRVQREEGLAATAAYFQSVLKESAPVIAGGRP
ncbi:MAG: UDP-glucuronic acid decarboxylase family protein [Planctomycetaceae bacterium]|nr:SDR family oxidoreductase [Planctomycetaceae bacterium]